MNVNRVTKKRQALPSGWRWVELGEVCEVATGGTPNTGIAEYYGGNIAWMKSGDVKGTYIDDATHQISEEGLQNSNARVHPRGTVLLAMSGQGKTRGLSAILRIEAACSQSVAAILPNEYLLPEIIHYWLMAHYDDTRGITGDNERSGLNLRLVRNIFIPIPPLSEQKRIAAILNNQMAAVEKARAAAVAQLEAAKALPAAYLRQAFPKEGQELPFGWRWGELAEVCEFLDSQRVPINEIDRTKRITGKPLSALYPYYGANGQVGWIDDYIFDEPLVLLAEDGGFFGSIERPIAYLISGKTWVNNHAHVLRPRSGIDIEFLWLMLAIRPDVGKLVTGNTRPKLNQDVASHIPTVIIPLVEQKRIAAILNEQLAAAERLRNDIEKQLHEINSLPAALLRQAFNGEL